MSVTADPLIGTEFLGYRIEALVGRGGMGVVYRAFDLRLKRNVALKLIAPELSQDEHFRERFLTETELAASLEHPNVVPIHDAGDAQDQLYLAMRYVEGSDLKQLLREDGTLSPERTIAICAQVAAALDAAHAHGLVHRDVKPSNVLLDSQEHIYLADFGLSRRLSDQAPGLEAAPSLGTPAYVAPEQIEGEEVDGRADVYSLGCLLHECLTGEAPFPRESELAVLWAHLNDPPQAPPGLEEVMAKALAKQPAERYASCGELVEAARDALGIAAPARPLWSRAPVVIALAGVALTTVALAAFLVSRQESGPAEPSTKPTLTPKVESLQRIDPITNRLAATIKLSARPSAIAVGEGAVWTANAGDRTVSRIDPKTDMVSVTSAAGGDPTYVAAGDGAVWVSNTGDRTLMQLDPRTLKIVHSFLPGGDDSYCGPAAVGPGAVWVVASQTLIRVGRDDNLIARVDGIPRCADSVAVGQGAVWVTASASPTLARVDPVQRKVVATIPLAFLPKDLAVDRNGVWLVDYADDSVVRIDPKTNRAVGTATVGDAPFAVAAGAGSIWTANVGAGTISRIDSKRGKVVATIKVGPRPTDIAAGEGGVWVTVSPT
jgi:serine/threonine protein kinase/sugar lactone lactonase YvrE